MKAGNIAKNVNTKVQLMWSGIFFWVEDNPTYTPQLNQQCIKFFNYRIHFIIGLSTCSQFQRYKINISMIHME